MQNFRYYTYRTTFLLLNVCITYQYLYLVYRTFGLKFDRIVLPLLLVRYQIFTVREKAVIIAV